MTVTADINGPALSPHNRKRRARARVVISPGRANITAGSTATPSALLSTSTAMPADPSRTPPPRAFSEDEIDRITQDFYMPKLCEHSYCHRVQPTCCRCVHERARREQEGVDHFCDACYYRRTGLLPGRVSVSAARPSPSQRLVADRSLLPNASPDHPTGSLVATAQSNEVSEGSTDLEKRNRLLACKNQSAQLGKSPELQPEAVVQKCLVCLDNPINVLFLPCAHLVCCEECTVSLFDADKKDGRATMQLAKIIGPVLLAQVEGHERINDSQRRSKCPEKKFQFAELTRKKEAEKARQISFAALSIIDTPQTKVQCPVCRTNVMRWLKIFAP